MKTFKSYLEEKTVPVTVKWKDKDGKYKTKDKLKHRKPKVSGEISKSKWHTEEA
jgi:major membrane immunogen (membrane-anchored lipoprotein)